MSVHRLYNIMDVLVDKKTNKPFAHVIRTSFDFVENENDVLEFSLYALRVCRGAASELESENNLLDEPKEIVRSIIRKSEAIFSIGCLFKQTDQVLKDAPSRHELNTLRVLTGVMFSQLNSEDDVDVVCSELKDELSELMKELGRSKLDYVVRFDIVDKINELKKYIRAYRYFGIDGVSDKFGAATVLVMRRQGMLKQGVGANALASMSSVMGKVAQFIRDKDTLTDALDSNPDVAAMVPHFTV